MRPSRVDLAVALAVAVAVLADLFYVERATSGVAVSAVAGVVVGLSLAARRTAPLAVACVVGAVLVAQGAAGGRLTHMLSTGIIGMALMFSTALHLPRRRALTGGLVFLAATWVDLAVEPGEEYPLLSDLVFTGVIVVAGPWLAGRALRERRERAEELDQLAAELAAEREERAALAVVEERHRIAREMHDVVAHSVSLMVVQAGAARRRLDDDPEQSRSALLSVEDVGRQALAELRRVLGMLRTGEPSSGLEPQPGIGQLEVLVAQAGASGLPVAVAVEGEPRPLAPGADLAAYRVVQEALTNTRKHAHATSASVQLHWLPDALELAVLDDGRGGVPAQRGHGLLGMRERVAAYGGHLDAGPVPTGGFCVRARIPLEQAARA